MIEYKGFLIAPDKFVYREPACYSVLRPEKSGAVVIHEGVVKHRFRTEKGATEAVVTAGRSYIEIF